MLDSNIFSQESGEHKSLKPSIFYRVCNRHFLHKALGAWIALLISFSSYAQTETNAPAAPNWNANATQPLLRAGISAVTLGALDIGALSVFGLPTGSPADGDHTFKLFDTRTAPYPSPPATGRPSFSPDVHFHHNWDIGSIGNVYGIAMDRDRNIYVTASTHYGDGYFEGRGLVGFGEIGTLGGVPDTAASDTNTQVLNDNNAAGAIYKIDAISGNVSVLARLPQQSYPFVNSNCENPAEATARNTGPALGNIEYDPIHHQLFVSNFEDGKIYRLSITGTVLSSFDPFVADDDSAGLAPDIKPYGLALNTAGDQLYFGTLDFNNPLDPGIYSVAIDSSGEFSGTEVDQDAHLTSDLNYAQNVGGGFTTNPWVSYSDMKFTPTGELMVGVRNGCNGSLGTSHNHGGTFYKLIQDGSGLFNTGAPGTVGPDGNFPIHYIADNLGPDDGYGGVAFFDKGDGTYDYLVTSADIEDEPGPHGFMVFPHNYSVGDNVTTYFIAQGASAAGLPSTEATFNNMGDYKGIIGDIETLPTPLDWGDAPDSYGTDNIPVDPTLPLDTVTNPGGAAHITSGDGITIGATVDPEGGGIPTVGADGDDSSDTATGIIDDEDAFAMMVMFDAGGNAIFNVPVNNPAAFDVTLYGWFDKNMDGVFDATEFVSEIVPAGTSTTVALDFGALPTTLDNFETYLRLRITSDVLAADTGFQGYASNGEIEDHLVAVKTVSLGSTIWNDADKDGVQDAGEVGIPGATVTLLDAAGVAVPGVAPVMTDANGNYNFNDLAPGTYRIQVDMNSVTNGGTYELTPVQNADPEGDDNTDSNYDAAADPTPNDDIYVSGDIILVAGAEPENEVDPINGAGTGTATDPDQPNQTAAENPDDRGNMTLDMGFFIPVDLGDAPDTYGTTVGAGGPSHVVIPELFIGTLNDDEFDGVPSPGADGDDLAVSDDEDGFGGAAISTIPVADANGNPTTTFTLNGVSATNTTGSPATLYGYIDFNGDGDFDDPGERSQGFTVPNGGAAAAVLDFAGISGIVAGDTYVRLRLSTDSASIQSPGGNAPDGEIEDHVITILPVIRSEKVLVPSTNGNRFDLLVNGAAGTLNVTNGGVTSYNSFIVGDLGTQQIFSETNLASASDGIDEDFLVQAICRDGNGAALLTGTAELLASGATSNTSNVSSANVTPLGNSAAQNTVSCSFSNFQGAMVSVVKNATPADVADDFDFTSTWSSGVNPIGDSFTLNGDSPTNLVSATATIAAGESRTLTVSEVPPAGWIVTAASCVASDADQGGDVAEIVITNPASTVFPSGASDPAVVVTVAGIENGDTVSCTFDNAQLVSIGSVLWVDSDLDGFQDVGESLIAGASVTLLNPDGTDAIDPITNAAFPSVTTGPSGEYNFNGVLPGDYVVRVDIAGATATGVFDSSNLVPTTTQFPDPDGAGAENDRNLDSNIDLNSPLDTVATDQTYYSGVVTLAAGSEPTAEANPTGAPSTDMPNQSGVQDDVGNMTVDFGFHEPYSVGSVVFLDEDDSGFQEDGEPGIENVQVVLYDNLGAEVEVGPDGILGTADDAAGGVSTNSVGEYNFSGLVPGDYRIEFTPPAGQYAPSTDQIGDPDGVGVGENRNLDSNLNVVNATDATHSTGIFTLGATEPTVELDPAGVQEVDPSGTANEHGNLTVDAGFVPLMNLGNQVWEDTNGNSLYEVGTDNPIPGATVTLLIEDPNNAANFIAATDAFGNPVGQITTGADGMYNFVNLLPGNYKVEVSVPAGFQPVATQVADPDGATGLVDTDNDSNLDLAATPLVETYTSGIVSLTGGDEPVDEEGAGDDGNNGNLTVDFGFFQPLSFGSVVFDDGDNDGVIEATDGNGVQDTGEAGINGATVSLFLVDPNNAANLIPVIVDANGEYVVGQVGTNNSVTTSNLINGFTVADGSYNFSGLPAGEYVTQVTPGTGYAPTNNQVVDPENGVNLDSNLDLSQTTPAGTWQSGVIDLQVDDSPTGAAENDLLGAQEVDPSGINQAKDGNSDLTIDYGFIQQVAIGNTVWLDDGAGTGGVQNDGIINGTEAGIPGVTVELYATGATPGTTMAVATTTTNASGNYLFDFLEQGTYFVHLPASNFATSGPLEDLVSSLPQGSDVASDDDTDENGQNTLIVGGVSSTDIELAINGEPTMETGQGGAPLSAQVDANTNLTVDFGLVPAMNLGNQVWEDTNLNSVYDAGTDNPIPGATVTLLMEDPNNPTSYIPATDIYGAPVGQQITGVTGQYNFTNLLPGNYKVEVSAPAGFQPVATQVADPDGAGTADTDNDSNIDLSATGTVETYTSGIVSLSNNDEPVDEEAAGNDGNNGNLTVDFGFYQPLSFGSVVFDDGDNDGVIEATDRNGVQDAGEPGINGAKVSLFMVDPNNAANLIPVVVDADGVYVVGQIGINNSVTTSNLINSVTVPDGSYNFSGLPAGEYVVQVMPGIGFIPTDNQVTDPENGVNLDSNLDTTVVTPYGTWQSGVIDLQVGDSPEDPAEDDVAGNPEVDPSGVNQDKDDNSDLTVDFGFVQQVAIGNTVWLDDGAGGGTKDDGIINGTEKGIAGVTVELYASGDTPGTDAPVATTITDSSGNYLFDFLDQATYFVHIPSDNFDGGAPLEGLDSSASEGGDVTDDDNADENGQNTLVQGGVSSTDIVLAIGGEPENEAGQIGAQTSAQPDNSTNLTVDFGFVPELLGTIGNYVWIDENSDGEQGAAEQGIPNVTVQLKDSAGTVIATMVTDTDGGYLFTDLPAGDYFVDIDDATIPAGMTQTDIFTHVTDGDDADAVDDDGDFGNKDHAGNGYAITLDEGEDNLTADFGYNWNPATDVNTNTGLAALGDRVWIDTDGDGVQDPNETPVEGVALSLFIDPDGDGVFDTPYAANPTQTTDANGNYLFDDLPADAYVVVVTDSATASHDILNTGEYAQTGDPDHFGANQTTADAGEAGDNQSTSPVVLSPGDVYLNVDFGYQPDGAVLGSIGDTIWMDLDGDGSGPNIASIDGQDNPTIGQGNNAEDDAAEPTIPGVTVALIQDDNGNGRADAGEAIIATDITDENGQYLFDGLADGDYVVQVTDTGNVLDGLTQTYDSDGALGSPNESGSTITGGGVDRTQDFAYVPDDPNNPDDGPLGSIGDTVWADLDGAGGDQSTQGSEPGLANVTVNLYVDEDGDNAPDDVNNDGTIDDNDAVATTTTDGNGNYLFEGLPLTTYIVGVDDSTLPDGYNPSSTYLPEGAGTEDDGDTANDLSDPVTLSSAEPHNRDQDFSYPTDPTLDGSGVIGDTIWGDLDSNGRGPAGVTPGPNAAAVDSAGDPDEPLLAGVTVRLFDDTGALVATDVTDSNGNYLFTGLDQDGVYSVVVDTTTLPAAYQPDPTGEPDGDANSVTLVDLGDGGAGTEDGVSDPDGENSQNLGQDFGYPPAVVAPADIVGSIGDTIWFDVDDSSDSQANQGAEPGLAGITVTLTPPAGVDLGEGVDVPITTVTDANGEYLFTDLPLDDGGADTVYTVTVSTSDLPSYVDSSPSFDADGGDDSTSEVTLSNANPDDRDQDFSYPPQLAPASLGDTIFIDNGGNPGVQDLPDSADPDTPVSGVLVNLLEDTDGDGTPETPVGSQVTDENGKYLFTGLDPNGVYAVVVDPSNTAAGGVLEGMTNTVDPDGGNDETSEVDFNDPLDGNADPDGVENNTNLGQDFGYTADTPTNVGNLLWLDVNGDGNYDPLGADGVVSDDDETPIGGVTIELYRDLNGNGEVDPGEPLFGTTTTSDTIDAVNFEADGNYLFADLPADTYVVKVTDEGDVLAGYNHSEGIDNTNNNSQDETYAVSTVGGVDDLTADFGYYSAPGAVGDVVWEDINGDGLYDPATEPGIDGVTVTLDITYPNGETTSVTTTTAFGGKYEFDNLLLDEDFNGQITTTFGSGGDEPLHSVSIDPATTPGHLDPIYDNFPANTDSVPAVGDEAGGIAGDEDDADVGGDDGTAGEPAYPPQGGIDSTNDFGFSPLASLGNRVWLDLDRDGVQDANEDGIPNVTVNLLIDSNGNGVIDGAELTTPSETTSTGPNGEYLFTDLLPGTVYIAMVDVATVPTGLTQTFDEGDGVGATDSTSDPITLTPNEEHLTADFGYSPAAGVGTIGDRIWVDTDGDGIQDPGEIGLPNVTVSLQPAPDVDLGNGNGVAIEVDTDVNGNYLFTNLPLNETYIVKVVDIATDAPLYAADPDGSGDPDVLDGNSTDHDDETTVVLTDELPVNLNSDFGYLPNDPSVQNSIGDTIWKDLDEDGNGPTGAGDESDTNEPPLPGVTVTLLDSTGTPIATTTTDSSGQYLFTGLPDGDYTVVVTDQNNVLGGLNPTVDSDDPANPGAFVPTTPLRSEVTGLAGGMLNNAQDFGFVDPSNSDNEGSIGDQIFFDSDGSGDSSNSDPNVTEGVEGVTVQLFGPGPDGDITTTADNVLVDTTVTDENGNYLFTGVDVSDTGANPGTDYQVVVVTSSLPNNGSGWINDTDPETVLTGDGDSQSIVTLSTGGVTQDLDQDFGYTSDVMNTITGTVWPDTDGDGEQVETGAFAGVTIELRDEDGNVIQTTQTDSNGDYTFTNLPDGIYVVAVTDEGNVLGGYEHTDSPNGASDVSDQTSKDDTGYRVDLDSAGASATAVTNATGDFGYKPTITNPISLGYFSAVDEDGLVTISWSTQTEVANLGFNVYGMSTEGWILLNDSLIISQGDSVGVQDYVMSIRSKARMFALSDIDLNGKETLHGPYKLGESYGVIADRRTIDWEAEATERQTKKDQRAQKRMEQQRQRNESRKQKKQETSMLDSLINRSLAVAFAVIAPAAHAAQADGSPGEDIVNLHTTESGIHYVDYADLADFGLEGIPIADIAIVNQGQGVASLVTGSNADPQVFGSGAGITFIAETIDTLYTDTNVYTLRLDQDDVVSIGSETVQIPNGASANAYLATKKYAPQSKYSFVSPDKSDPWYATRIVAVGNASDEVVNLNLDNVAVGGNTGSTKAKLKVNVWGSTDLPGAGNDHHVKVYMNGNAVMDSRFDGLQEKELNSELEQINSGDNYVKISLPMDTGFAFDAVNINEIEVSYPRQFVVTDGRLDFDSTFNKFDIKGLTKTDLPDNESSLVVMREDASGQITNLSGHYARCRNSGCKVEVAGTGRLAHYYVSSKDARHKPSLQPLPLEEDISSGNAAYLIISHPDFIGSNGNNLLEALATDVASEYGSADVVDVEAIYAQYGNHIFDPQAIRSYIQDSVSNRGTKVVLLVGGDVYDYRKFENENAESFIPSIYAATGSNVSFAPVDAKYVDLDDDNVPDLPIGRLPVRTASQLASLLGKRDDYIARSYGGKVLLVADGYDEAQQYDFGDDADEIENDYLSGASWNVEKAYVDDLGVSQARSSVINNINQGQTLTAFFGHSSTNQWSFSGLFNGPDAANLQNQGKPTVVTQWGCWNAYYVSPNEDSMGHRFMMEGDQGAVAVMGASTLTNADSERVLARMVFERLANGERLGEAVTNAKQEYAQDNPNDLDVLLGWTILGLPELFVN